MKDVSHAGPGQMSFVRLACIGQWEMGRRSFQGGPVRLGGVYRTGTEAVQCAAWGGVHVALIDDRLPDLDTLNCLRRIGQLAPRVRLVVASERLGEESAMLWLVAGAAGCVAKCASMDDLAHACLVAVHAGLYLPPNLLRRAVSAVETAAHHAAWAQLDAPRAGYTARCDAWAAEQAYLRAARCSMWVLSKRTSTGFCSGSMSRAGTSWRPNARP